MLNIAVDCVLGIGSIEIILSTDEELISALIGSKRWNHRDSLLISMMMIMISDTAFSDCAMYMIEVLMNSDKAWEKGETT